MEGMIFTEKDPNPTSFLITRNLYFWKALDSQIHWQTPHTEERENKNFIRLFIPPLEVTKFCACYFFTIV